MFSIVNSVMLRPLNYPEPGRLVFISETIPKVSHLYPSVPATAGHLVRWQKEMRSFEGAGGIDSTTLNLTGAGEPERLGAVAMTWEFLHVLGLRPQLGRWFLAEEGKPDGSNVAILSDSLWRRRFGADPGIVGKKIQLDSKPYEVVGVTPRGMTFPRGGQLHHLVRLPERADVFVPLRFTASQIENQEGDYNYGVVARLRKGVTLEQARAEMAVLMAAVSKENRLKVEVRAQIEPLQQALVGNAGRGLLVLLGAVGFVLLIVCVNVANLTLVRATGRRREIAIRAALGASRWQLVRHLMIESLTLALLGGALGMVAALWIVDLLVSRVPVELPRIEESAVDWGVLFYALLLCVGAAGLFGILPAWQISHALPRESLQAGSRHTDGPRGGRLRGVLVSIEVALSTVLLVGAGLLLASFWKLMNVDRGFEVQNVVAADLSLPDSKYHEPKQRRSFFRRVLEGVEPLPGVLHAGYVSILPLTREGDISMVIKEGGPDVPLIERPITTYRKVSSGYFPSLGIPLRRGRLFTDEGEKESVAVISEGIAARVWPGQDPVGKRFQRGGDSQSPWWRIVGVVGDVRAKGLDKDPELMIYQPYWQRGSSDLSLVVRTSMDPDAIAAAIRQQVWRVDPDVPVPPLRTMERIVSDSVSQRRFQATLVGAFALTALLLASIGLAAGVAAAVALSQLLAGLLFQVSPLDPATFILVPVLLLMVAALACYAPARRATRTDPIEALRYE